MKDFIEVTFDPEQIRNALDELGDLLNAHADLSESKDIQPFFKARQQLTAFLGTYVPELGPANRIAYEFPIFGDFAADIIVGNKHRGTYCLIELEEATFDSVFTSVKGKSTKEWSRRFEHGFSQLVDWFYSLDDLRNSRRFAKDYGHGHITFAGMLVIGRSVSLSDNDRHRLRWRADKISINNNHVHCLTFDDLFEGLSWRMSHYPAPPKGE